MSDQISWLTPRHAQEARSELLAALGTENNPGQWMVFMQTVTRLLPDILKSGRASEQAIEQSIIGQLGFKSWKAMVEAPTHQGGLGWNISAWNAWRRAWKTVQTWPYLVNLDITAAEVNRLHQETKDRPEGFPSSPQALEAWKQQRRQEKTEKRAESLESLRNQVQAFEKRVQELTRSLDLANTRADNLEQSAQAANQVLDERSREIGHLQAQAEHQAAKLKAAQQQAQKAEQERDKARRIAKKYQRMSRWDYFLRAFGRG